MNNCYIHQSVYVTLSTFLFSYFARVLCLRGALNTRRKNKGLKRHAFEKKREGIFDVISAQMEKLEGRAT